MIMCRPLGDVAIDWIPGQARNDEWGQPGVMNGGQVRNDERGRPGVKNRGQVRDDEWDSPCR